MRSRIKSNVYLFFWLSLMGLMGCTGVPEGVTPVTPFALDRYLGTRYEIARLDHGFERGLSSVTATYTLQEDGSLQVINQGYRAAEDRWIEAEGKARFVSDPDVGHFKVSFFGPFYSSYVVFGLDQADYQYAFVSGFNREFLWLLARTPTVDSSVIADFEAQATALGFPLDELIMVTHEMVPPAVTTEQSLLPE